MKKKVLCLILGLAMVFSVVGCGSKEEATEAPAPEEKTEAEAPAEEEAEAPAETGAYDLEGVEKTTLKLAHIYAADHPFSIGLEEFVAKCDELSGGLLEIQHFMAAQIGDEPSIHEGLRNGSVDMAVMGISEVGKRYEPILVMDAPFIFENADHMLAANESETGKELWANFEAETGVKMLNPLYYGTRQLTTKEEVDSTADLQGKKIRVPNQENSVAAWTAFGAVPTPMNLGEVYLSIQTGVVDGQENPLATIVSQGFHEVCPYINMTYHSVQNCPLFISVESFNALAPGLQQVLLDAAAECSENINNSVKEYEESVVAELEAGGNIINTDVDRDDFLAAVGDYLKESEAVWGEGVFDALQGTAY